ncbi:peptidoglycan-binding protein [Eubacteriales bacterium OttesenSCG-928-N13]|nr:peptidoglycan-binding protein [Eubacteriales bacterium OttesenSCG-928-N13]
MFCSKCGKTLTQDAVTCPHCGATVGESRFEGFGYTAAQQRYMVGENESARNQVPYTRTTYTSTGEEPEQQEGDIYSRTTYRPILKEEQPEPKIDEPAPAEDASTTKDAPKAVEPQAIEPEQSVAAVAGDASVVIAPLKPIKKTGISPEVQQYIQRMNEQKERKQKGSRATDTDALPQDAELDSLAMEPAQDDEGAVQDTPVRRSQRSEKVQGRALPAWLKPAVAILCILVILGVSGYLIMMNLSNASQLEGVSYDVRQKGLELINNRLSPEYRTPIVALMKSEYAAMGTEGATAAADKVNDVLAASQAEIDALMPEEGSGLKNDKLFVSAIGKLQTKVDNAMRNDALAQSSTDENTTNTLTAIADEAWADVENYATALTTAKEEGQLQGIDKGLNPTPTPAPDITPTPAPYKTLKNGMNNNKNVKKLQLQLQKLGYFNGTVDSDYGRVTVTAVKKFQQAAGLEANGIADSATQEALYADDAPKYGTNATPAPDAAPTLSAGTPAEPTPSPDDMLGMDQPDGT